MALKPTDIPRPDVARAKAARARPTAVQIANIVDNRGAAAMEIARGTRRVSGATMDLASRTREAGKTISGALNRKASAQAQFGQAKAYAAAVDVQAIENEAVAQSYSAKTFSNFAKTIANVADTFSLLEERRRDASNKAWMSRYRLEETKAATMLEEEHLNSPKEGVAYIEEGDEKLAKTHEDITKKVSADLGYELDDNGKEQLTEYNLASRSSFARNTAVAANNQRTANLVTNVDNDVQEAVKLGYSDGDLGNAIAHVDASLDTLEEVLPADKLDAKRKVARSLVVEGVVQGHLARGEIDKAQTILNIATGIDGKGATAVTSTITSAAKKSGVDPLTLLAIGKIESGLDPNAKNPESSAAGYFQFTSSTGKQYGLPSDARKASLEQQANAAAQLTAANVATLQKFLGTPPAPREIYLAHFLGAGRALDVINADPDTELSAILPDKVLRANPQLVGMTAGDMLTWSQKKMQQAMDNVVSSGTIAERKVAANQAGIPLEDIFRLNRQIEQARGAQITTIGKTAALKMQTMTSDDIEVFVSGFQPAADDTGRARTLYDSISKSAAAIVKLRQDDPALAVANLPDVQRAAEAARSGKPEDVQAAVQASLRAQEMVGIPAYARNPITKAEAKELALPIISASRMTGRDDVTKDERLAVEMVINTVIQKYGQYADEVLPHVIEATTKDRQMGPLASSLFRKIVKGNHLTPGDRQKLGASADAANATNAVKPLPELKWDEYNAEMGISAQQTKWPVAPLTAIQALRDDPRRAGDFDRKYGPGASNRILKAVEKK